ncbi:fibronectin type III domain-containing protein [Reinekea sp.]|jgi:hypothetical protein|uniref:fibronectin type III domain-containing protein n=1 Tax=Reinekea sp. TaxID=1970455 RepID=UPI003988D155
MNIQLTLLASVLTLALSGCQVEGLATQGNAADDTDTTVTVTKPNSNTPPEAEPTDPDVGNNDPIATASVTLYWSAPLERVNGQSMDMTEVGGYEIRYKQDSDDSYTNVVIDDKYTDQYTFIDLSDADAYQFEVAVFDSDGIYSDFVIAMAN